MKLIKLYEWLVGKQNDFVGQFSNNEQLYNQANQFWNNLNGIMPWVVGLILIGIVMAYGYYKPFNNGPGRRYTVGKWGLFLGITFLITLGSTLVVEYCLCDPMLKGAWNIEITIAILNSIYAGVAYLLTSFAWCNLAPTTTNAYPFLKLSKS